MGMFSVLITRTILHASVSGACAPVMEWLLHVCKSSQMRPVFPVFLSQVRRVNAAWARNLKDEFKQNAPTELELVVNKDRGVTPMCPAIACTIGKSRET